MRRIAAITRNPVAIALVAMLAYQASEDPNRVSTAQRVIRGPDGEVRDWPSCQPGRTSSMD